MNTISKDRRFRAASAAVTGARHLRVGRNGQDAAAAWAGDDAVAIVVCDGCSSGASSEVGARLGASLAMRALAARLASGIRIDWASVRADVVRVLSNVLEQMPGDRAEAIRDHFLFTVVAAVVTREEVAVWAVGDGCYAIGDRTRELGPFDDNQPPYLAYDLLGDPRPAQLEIVPARAGKLAIGTDGALALDLRELAIATFVEHPDALRRRLAILARSPERIDWDERRIVRTPATLQDDCAVGVVCWEPS